MQEFKQRYTDLANIAKANNIDLDNMAKNKQYYRDNKDAGVLDRLTPEDYDIFMKIIAIEK